MKRLNKNIDYVEFYENKLKNNSDIFKQQKKLIDSQIISSKKIFKQKFAGDFEKNARLYLKEVGVIK